MVLPFPTKVKLPPVCPAHTETGVPKVPAILFGSTVTNAGVAYASGQVPLLTTALNLVD